MRACTCTEEVCAQAGHTAISTMPVYIVIAIDSLAFAAEVFSVFRHICGNKL